MDIVSGDLHTTTALYSNVIRLGALAPVGDLYERMEITFEVPVEDTDQLLFFTDTDLLRKDATLTATPEPASFGLLALGLLGAVGVGRLRRGR